MADPDASYVELFNREYPRLLRSVGVITGDREAAADVVQEAFVRLLVRWNKLSGYDRPAPGSGGWPSVSPSGHGRGSPGS